MLAKDLMTRNPLCIAPDAPVVEAARLFASHDFGALPVIDEATRRPLGMITDRDLVCRVLAARRDPEKTLVKDCMSGPCTTVSETSDADTCCDAMEASQIRRVVVVDAAARVVGIIAQADIAQALSVHKAAEVLREISLPTEVVHATF